jgi:hypothetical protein
LNITNLLFAEPLLVEALTEGVSALKSVGTWAEMPETITDVGTGPCAYVIYEGSGSPDNSGSASLTHQYWTVALPLRRGQTRGGQAEQRELAGELLASIHSVCQGLKLPGCKKLELHDGPAVRYYPGGQAVFYLTYALHCPLLA